MNRLRLTEVLRYGSAVIGVLLATLMRRALDPVLGDLFPFATLFLAVLIVAGYSGRGPALLATALGAVASARFLLAPREGFAVQGIENQAGMLLYLVVGVGFAILGGAMQAARRLAEENAALAVRQREQMRITLSSIGDAVLVTDAEGRVTSLNPVAESLTGWSSAEAAGQPLPSVFRIVNEETRRPVENPSLRALREGAVVGLANHTLLIARDGTERPIDDSAAPIRDSSGRVVGVILVFRDVTERKQAEAEARRAGERARSILENITDAFFTLDRDWRFTDVNRQAEAVLGRSRGDLVGKCLWEEYPGTVGNDIERRYRLAMEGGQIVEFEEFYPPHDRWYENHLYPTEDGLSVYFRDITKRRRHEEELRASDERLRLATEATGLGIWELDLQTGVVLISDLGKAVFGLAPSEELTYESFLSILIPEDRDRVQRAVQEALDGANAGRYAIEYQAVGRGDGIFRWVEAHGQAYFDRERRAVRFLGTLLDITERKRADGELRASEERFRHLADAMPQIVWITRPDRTVEYVNRRWLDYTGQTPEEALAPGGWAAAVHPEDVPGVLEASARSHATGEPFEAEYRVRDAGGGYRWHLGRAVPIFDEAGGLVRRFGAATNIDDRKRIERDAHFLAEASAGLASIVDEASTLQQVARLAVPHFADWCAVDLAGEEGLPRRLAVAHIDPAKVELAHELDRRYPPDPDAPVGIPRVLRTGSPELLAEITDDLIAAGAKDEEHLRILRELGLRSYMCVPLRGRAGTLGAISFVAAESGRRYGPEDLRLAEDLASRAAIAIENARLYAELREADRRKDEFLATLAHELRNPLAPIRNALHLMAFTAADGNGHEAERAMAERQVVHLARLVDDLMDVARIARGKIELQKEVMDLATVVGHAVESARPLIDERRHRLTVSLPEGPLRLEADPTRLEQVLWNLLNNAAKYTGPGGRIALSADHEGGEVVVRVRDAGMGIEPAMLPRLFQMFVQVGEHREHAQGGLGIGLGLVRTLVEMHGGSISAHSEGPGTGSEFVVRLPILPEGNPIETSTPGRRRDTGEKTPRRRILVVDDNVDAARSLARLLTRLHGHDVQVAHDGPAALIVAEEFQPEVVLLDIGMPGMDGNEVARRLRGRPEFDRTLIVALTGWGQQSDVERSRAAGFDHHLVKPANPDAILDLLTNSANGER